MMSAQLQSLAVSLLVAGVLSLGLVSPGLVLAGQNKVDVCHSEGNGTYHLISIAEPAYPTHVAHGDAKIGEDVPGMSGYVFDEECVPVEAVSCPCTFSADHIRSLFPEGATLDSIARVMTVGLGSRLGQMCKNFLDAPLMAINVLRMPRVFGAAPAPCARRLPASGRHAAHRRHDGLTRVGAGLEKCVCFSYPLMGRARSKAEMSERETRE
jgi:hypothetical protein